MTTEVTDALMALQNTTTASIEQTQASQTLAQEVIDKMTELDSSVSTAISQLFIESQEINQSVTTGISQLFIESRVINLMDVSGTADAIELTSTSDSSVITSLNEYEVIRFIASATNTAAVTVAVDGLAPIKVANITEANQIFETALVTLVYRQGEFYLTEQINPKTGNNVLDIGKLYTDTVDMLRPGEYALDGATINSANHPIACAIAAASSNYTDQATKDADLTNYAGYYGFYEEVNGTTTVSLPIVGGEFIRMFDDGRGVDDGRGFASWQEDAIRNITGELIGVSGEINNAYSWGFNPDSNGAFDVSTGIINSYNRYGGEYSVNSGQTASFDASLVVPTAEQNRPRSIAYYGKTRL